MNATLPEESASSEISFATSMSSDLPPPENGDEEDAMEENQHSLPSPEEIKASTPINESSFCNPILYFTVIFLLLSAAVIGLSVGLTADNRKDNNSAGAGSGYSQNSEKKKEHMKVYIIDNLVSTEQDLNDSTSPQSRALNFLASGDKKGLNAPNGGLDSQEGYAFITRYAMTTLYYATQGASWNYDLLFLSEHDTCEWYEVFTPPIGQVGVLCNENTNEIVGISFSKLFIC
jgi:hypothetical protein